MENFSDAGSVQIVPFDRKINRNDFSSGNLNLDQWLKKYSGQSEDRGQSRTFFAINKNSYELLGYYASAFGEVSSSEADENLGESRYSRPAYLIARLAIDSRWQGYGIGRLLLFDALDRATRASSLAGLELVIVDAIDEQVVKFYEDVGFIPFSPGSTRLFITMKRVVRSS